jgi:PAS domain S-box-containing protein
MDTTGQEQPEPDSLSGLATNEKDLALERNGLAIHLQDPTAQRLIEGLGVQLNLRPTFVSDEDLRNFDLISTLAIIVADVDAAGRYRDTPPLSDHPASMLRPALVAVFPYESPEHSLLPQKGENRQFDGVLSLPQVPSIVLAQLSVILYAHRSTILRYGSALDELHLNRRIFRSVTSGISVADARHPDLPLLYVNPAFEVVTGYSLEEIAGRNCRFLQREDRDQPGRVLIREAIQEQRSTVAILRNYRKDGTPFWNELSMSPIFDKEGHLTHYVGIQNDVTARVNFEEALRQSEKLAATGRLAASIAHEINNPLEAMTNLLYLARHGSDGEDEKNNYLDLVEEELRRVSALTTQSLRFYRQTARPRAVRVCDVVQAVLDVYSVRLKTAGTQVDFTTRSEDSIVCLDSEIRQVLSNLISNAIDAMRGQTGKLTLRCQNSVMWKTETRGVSILVADTGKGMSKETKTRLFEAFYTTKQDHGTGLGLWLSQEIIARHHGVLNVRSTEGGGSVFRLTLPFQAIHPEAE